MTNKNNKCSACGAALNAGDSVFTIGENKFVCYECASRIAIEARNEKREIEITEGSNEEVWQLCEWCHELLPESDLHDEADLGKLCDHCISGISSRGEELFIQN